MKKKFRYIVIILVYKNGEDLKACIDSLYAHISDCKIIVVNAFYDENSKQQIEKIACENNCDFINVPNKGYSYGNNRGIDYAKEHYTFDYIIISNPDTVVQQFKEPLPEGADILAAHVTTLSGKWQNPMMICESRLSKYLIYKGFVRANKWLMYAGIAINKLLREVGCRLKKLQRKTYYPIYAAHGSFLLISSRVVEKIVPLYDENMFLFAEECVLADKARVAGFRTYYTPAIKVLHKEDGSMKLSNFSLNKELAKANIYYYEHYVKGK